VVRVYGGYRHLPAHLAGIFGRAFVPVELLLKARQRIVSPSEALMGTLNSWLQRVQIPTAGVAGSHLATLRRRWILGNFPRLKGQTL
jgi:hypothetical protein